jgi:hypothetical protein
MPLNEGLKPTTRNLRSLLAFAALAVLASAVPRFIGRSVEPSQNGHGESPRPGQADRSTTLVYTPGDGLYANVGGRTRIYIPANAICDPGSAGYGAGTWDKSCAAATRSHLDHCE